MNWKSSFKSAYILSNVPIENARRLDLEKAIGNAFKIEDAETVKNGNEIRTTYSVRTLNSQEMPTGTLINIVIKGQESVFNKQMALDTLTGVKAYIIRFDNINHWLMATKSGLREGLSAEKAEIINIPIEKVIKNE